MKVPAALRAAIAAEFAKALPGLIERAWATYQAPAVRPTPAAPGLTQPRKRRVGNKIEKGRARVAILATIKRAGDEGITRADLRLKAPQWLNGKPISENTIKSVLMFLREKQDIETKNSKWYDARRVPESDRMQRTYTYDKTGRRVDDDE